MLDLVQVQTNQRVDLVELLRIHRDHVSSLANSIVGKCGTVESERARESA
jgi:hypothetical protein